MKRVISRFGAILVMSTCIVFLLCCFTCLAADGNAKAGRSVTVNTILKGSGVPVGGVSVEFTRYNPLNTNAEKKPVYTNSSLTSATATSDGNGKINISDLYNDTYYFRITGSPSWVRYISDPMDNIEILGNTDSSMNIELEKLYLGMTASVDWKYEEDRFARETDYKDVWGILECSTDRRTGWVKAPGSSITKTIKPDYVDYPSGNIHFKNSNRSDGLFPATDDHGKPYFYRVRQVDGSGDDYIRPGWMKNETVCQAVINNKEARLDKRLGVVNILDCKDIVARKVWLDVPKDEPKPDVYFKLYGKVDGDEARSASSKIIKVGDDHTAIWYDMSKYTNDGKRITYFVKEVDADGNEWENDKYDKREEDLTVYNIYSAMPSVAVKIESEVKTARKGDIIPYTITISNTGDGTAYDYPLTDYIGEGLEYVDNDFGGVPDEDSNTVEWNLRISEGEEVEIGIRLRVTKDVPGGFVNTVRIEDSIEHPVDPDKATDEYTVDLYVPPQPAARPASKPAEVSIPQMINDKDLAGSKIAPLYLKSTKQTKKSVNLKWKKVTGADSYIIYGNRCGRTVRPVRLLTVRGKTTYTVRKIQGKKLKKGTYYKFFVVAVDRNNQVLSISKTVHAVTRGSKWKNHKAVKVTNASRFKSLKAGKTRKIKARQTGSNVKVHVGLRYESLDPKVAKVNSRGKVRAVSKGRTQILVYSQNGKCKKITVNVK